MSYQDERRFVLDMLETGMINPDQATRLLDVLSLQPAPSFVRDSHRRSPNKVYLEIDADQNTLQQVLEKLNNAVSPVIQH